MLINSSILNLILLIDSLIKVLVQLKEPRACKPTKKVTSEAIRAFHKHQSRWRCRRSVKGKPVSSKHKVQAKASKEQDQH